MEMYRINKLYKTGANGVDEFGVDHSNFSLRDELEYNMKIANEKNNGTNGITNNNNSMVNDSSSQTDKGVFEQFTDNLGNIARKTGLDKITNNLYNLGYDGGERLAYPQQNSSNYDNKSSLGLAQSESQRLTPIPISDVNKHQYVSCIGSYDGPISAGITAGAGLYKEGKDLYNKWNNPKYGSNMDIIQDCLKDLKNDAIGISRGLSSNNINNCNYLLPFNARRK